MTRRPPRSYCLILGLVLSELASSVMAGDAVNESARQIPVAYDVDVVIVGGSTGAVSASSGPSRICSLSGWANRFGYRRRA